MEKIIIGSRQTSKQFQEQETKLNKDSVIETIDGTIVRVGDIKDIDFCSLCIYTNLSKNVENRPSGATGAQPTCNRQVRGFESPLGLGGVPEWTIGADCKSAAARLRRFESYSRHKEKGGNKPT